MGTTRLQLTTQTEGLVVIFTWQPKALLPKPWLRPVPVQPMSPLRTGSVPALTLPCAPTHPHSARSLAPGRTPGIHPGHGYPWARACCNLFLGTSPLQPSNSRPAHGSADLDPFKFRWLIPISALQVRLGNTAGRCFLQRDAGKHVLHDLFGWQKEHKNEPWG